MQHFAQAHLSSPHLVPCALLLIMASADDDSPVKSALPVPATPAASEAGVPSTPMQNSGLWNPTDTPSRNLALVPFNHQRIQAPQPGSRALSLVPRGRAMSTQASPQRRRRAISDAPLPPTPTTWIFSPLPKQASHERSLSPASPAAASVAESLKSSHQPSREDEGQAGRDQQNREPQKKEEPSVEILVMKCCFFPGKEKERLVVLSFGLSKATRQLRSFSSVPDCIRGVLNVKKWCHLQRAMLWGRDRSKDVAKLASIADGLCSNGMPKWKDRRSGRLWILRRRVR